MVLVLSTIAITTAWVIIIIRAALTITYIERYLLATIAAMCAMITLYHPYVFEWFNRSISLDTGFYARHIISIAAAALMVSFATTPTHPRRIKWWIAAAVGISAAIMLLHSPAGLITTPHKPAAVITVTGFVDMRSVTYFALTAGYCVAASLATIISFITAARIITNAFTKISLRLFCVSVLLDGITWIAAITSLVTRQQVWVKYDLAFGGLEAFFLAAALLVALGGTIRARVQLGRTARRLYPLWLALTDTVPGVVLTRVPGWRRGRYGIQRLVVELRDCFLVLGGYLDQDDVNRIRQHTALSTSGSSTQGATVTALSLHHARANKIAGKPPAVYRVALLPSSSGASLDDDLAELIHIADAYRAIANDQAGQTDPAGAVDRILHRSRQSKP